MIQPALSLHLLGELEVRRDGRALALPASKKTRALLAYLAAVPGPHRRANLCDVLWEGPDDPRAALRWSLTKLRPLLNDGAAERLLASREHVRLQPRRAEIDAPTVRGALGEGLDAAPLEEIRASLALFRGEFLEGLDLPDCYRFQEWLVAEREAWRALRLSALEVLVDRLALSQPGEALAQARAWVALDPFAEAAHVAVMRLLGRLGRCREAMEQYQGCLRMLQQELGVAPSAELEAARLALRAAPTAVGRQPTTAVAVPRATTPLRGAASAPAMVGRARELRTLRAWLSGNSGAAAPPPGMVLLLGEPGIGKTHLLGELMAAGRRAGQPVLYGRAFEAEMVRPYGAWIDALRSTDLVRIPAELRPDLAPLLPELGGATGALGDRERLFLAVDTLIATAPGEPPALVILDDLHWIDDASAALIHYVLRGGAAPTATATASPSARVRPTICCAARPGELADNPSTQRLLRALGRERRLKRLELRPLDREATGELVRLVDPAVDSAPVFAGSEGNPLFVLELARAHAHGRVTEGGVPETLAELIADRLARLEATARELVLWASALGRDFELEILGRAAGLEPAPLLAAVGELERHAILCPLAASALYDFTHDLVRQAAYRQISTPRRRLMHRQIARVLATVADPEGALAGELARHAARAGEDELAALSCARAGERSLRLFANAEAGELAQRGLRHARGLALPIRLPLAMRLYRIHVHSRLGRDRSAQVEEDIQRLTVEAREAGLHAEIHTGLYLLAVLHDEGGDPLAVRELSLSQAEAARIADPLTAARALANTGRCLAQIEHDVPRAERLLEEAQTLARSIGVHIVDLPWGIGLVRHFRGDEPGAGVALSQALAIARREQEHWAEYQCLERLTMIDLEAGRSAVALARQAELHAVAARLSAGSEAPMASMLGALARRAQEPTAAAPASAATEEALAALRAIDTKGLLAYALNVAAGQDLASAHEQRARAHAEEALDAATAVGRRTEMVVARALLARLAARAGDRAASTAHLAAARAVAGSDDDPVHCRAHRALELAMGEVARSLAQGHAGG
jgi:DNA-binding SARP family transcriptional activator